MSPRPACSWPRPARPISAAPPLRSMAAANAQPIWMPRPVCKPPIAEADMSDPRFPTVITDGVAEVSLAAGKANALSIEAALALADHLERLGRSPDLAVV